MPVDLTLTSDGKMSVPESKTREYKQDLSSPGKAMRALVAFANWIEPRLVPTLELATVSGKSVLVVSVAVSGRRPHHIKNEGPEAGAYVRLGNTNRQADPGLVAELERGTRAEYFDKLPVTWRQGYDRQLQFQQDGLNDLTIAEWEHSRAEFRKPEEEGGGRIGKTEQDAARVEAGGVAGDDTAILHGPDQVAGGRPNTYDGLGSSRINSSIGAQWERRITGLRDEVDATIGSSDLIGSDLLRFVHMNVRLVS